MADNRPSSINEQASFQTNRDTFSVTDYRKAALEELFKIEQQNIFDLDKIQKDIVDKQFSRKKAVLDKLNTYQIGLQEVFEKKKQKLKEKYGDPEDLKAAEEHLKKKYEKELAHYKTFLEQKQKLDTRYQAASIIKNNFGDWTKWRDFRIYAKENGMSGSEQFKAITSSLISSLSDFAKKLDNTIDTIGGYQSKWDTRLYGYSGGNYSSITKTVTGAAGMSPIVQQAKIMQNIDNLVQQGIAYNVEQRAFLATISDKIATTFDAANGTLLQLVRIQQQDTTAARLGLEAGVTKYLNNMFANSEYMTSIYKNTLSSIYEASSQFTGSESIGFEYQVQKWLGSLYSVGMSSGAVQNIASAIGQLGSGNVNALSGGMQNLMVMAASKGGLSYSDLLTGGLSGDSVNRLMAGLVTYLADAAASNNNVVKSQYANIFGLSLSDLKAISNLAGSVGTISGSNMNYGSAMSNLFGMANSAYSRMNPGELMNNVWNNAQYSMASGIAANPALFAIYKAAGLLDSVAGGIALPDIKYLGTGVNLQTSVADLMRVGALGGGILNSIGSMISSSGNGGWTGGSLLSGFGIKQSGVSTVTRGNGITFDTSGASISQSNYVGNASGSDMQSAFTTEAENDANSKLAKVQAEQENISEEINNNVLKIYELLQTGITVTVTDYGLTNPSGM